MGGLHEGHGQLIRSARSADQGSVLVSIFVNPLQFAPNEDFARYPRTLEADVAVAASCGADAIWVPSVASVYPDGPENVMRIQVPESLQRSLCGCSRPGHFDGVATVVARLLAMVRPDRLVLGEKDW